MAPSNPRATDLRLDESKDQPVIDPEKHKVSPTPPRWRSFFTASTPAKTPPAMPDLSSDGFEAIKARPVKWSLGMLNDKETDEVPGTSVVCSLGRNFPGVANLIDQAVCSSCPTRSATSLWVCATLQEELRPPHFRPPTPLLRDHPHLGVARRSLNKRRRGPRTVL